MVDSGTRSPARRRAARPSTTRRLGALVFEHAIFRPSDALEQRLALFSPLPEEDTPAKLARLLAD